MSIPLKVLDASAIYLIQQLQTDLTNIVDLANFNRNDVPESTFHYIINSLDDGISALFEIKNQLGDE